MKVKINDIEYTVPEKEILRLKTVMKISAQEAAQIWLEDEGKIINPEQKALDEKAKKVKIDHGATSEKVIEKKMSSTPKPKASKPKTTKDNPTKEKIIADIAEMLSGYCENVNITNKAKIIEFSFGGENFKIDLTQKRKPKAE